MNTIKDFRDFYARYVAGYLGRCDDRLIAAFAAVERERYVGAGPWKVWTLGSGYIETPDDDPRVLYQDILIGLAPERGLNNGQPSLHGRCLASCNPKAGNSIVHVGAGTGYYTAILAELAGPAGHVTAYEVVEDLAEMARQNLSHLPNVNVLCASGCDAILPEADVVYVNAGATHPVTAWLDALNLGGRLIFPLTPIKGVGCMLLVTRLGETKYAAAAVSGAAFTPCIGACDQAMSEILTAAMKKLSAGTIKSLHRNDSPDDSVWCKGNGWWLSTGEPAD